MRGLFLLTDAIDICILKLCKIIFFQMGKNASQPVSSACHNANNAFYRVY